MSTIVRRLRLAGWAVLKGRYCLMRRNIGRMLLVGAALVASLAVLGVSSAMATPKGEYAVFAQCPVSNPNVNGCLVSLTESGKITIGKQEVPIVNTQTLQGGTTTIAPGVKKMAAAINGETLSKTSQKVPGGLSGLVNCTEIKGSGFFEKLLRAGCEAIFENEFTGVNATAELAAPASSVILNLGAAEFETGSALTLPIKVKLENPFLGKECYIGSNSNPITLHMSTGKSGSAKGKLGEVSSKAEGGILVIKNGTLVDNTFTAPEATGCGEGLSFLLDPVINAKIGLPAGEGVNTAVFNTKIEIASAALVEESEF
jgi:hypothetical protein